MFRIYIDTSVVGGLFDEEFEQGCKSLFDLFNKKVAIPVLSPILVAEVSAAPIHIRNSFEELISVAEVLDESIEALVLRDAYLSAGVLGSKWASDALHVAYATLARVDVIASWNFKHLVNSDKIRQFSAVNLARGFGLVVILSPTDVANMVEDGTDETS